MPKNAVSPREWRKVPVRLIPPTRLGFEQVEERSAATTFLWSMLSGGPFDWANPLNWGGSGFPNAASDVATITAATTGNQTINLNVPITLGTINIGSTGSGTTTLAANGGSLSFQDVSNQTALNIVNIGGVSSDVGMTINKNNNLTNTLTITNSSSGSFATTGSIATGANNLTITGTSTQLYGGAISSSIETGAASGGTVTVAGTGAVTFSAANTYQNATSVTGKLIVSNTTGSATGNGAVTVASTGTISGTGKITPAQPLVATSFFDSAVYQFNSETGALQKTIVAANTSAILVGPAGMTVGPDGNLYISSQFNDSIVKYDTTTSTLSMFIGSSILTPIATSQGATTFAPSGMKFGPDGNLYVSLNAGQSSTTQGAVIRFGINNSGGLSYSGTSKAIATGLIQPSGMTFGVGADVTSLYVSNPGLGSVIKITGSTGGAPSVGTFVSPGSGGLNFPSDLNWGPDGSFYVTDLGATSNIGQVLKFDANGKNPTVFTQPGNSLQFQFPAGSTFDSQGRLLTANLGFAFPPSLQGSISRFNANGTFDQTLVSSAKIGVTGPGTSGFAPSQIVLLPAPTLKVAGIINPGSTTAPGILTVGNVTLDSTSTFVSVINGTTAGTGYGELVTTGAVTLNNPTLSLSFTVTPPTSPPPPSTYKPLVGEQFTLIKGATSIAGTFNNLPEGSTFTSGGNLFKITYSGGATGHDVVLTRTADSLMIASSFFDGAIYEFDAETGALADKLLSPFASSLVSGIAGITMGPDGNMYISSQSNNKLLKFDMGTHAISVFIDTPVLAGLASAQGAPAFAPAGLQFGSDGNLYVSMNGGQSSTTGAVVRFDVANGANGLAFTGTSKAIVTTGLIQPSGMSFGTGADSANLYIANYGVKNVIKITGAMTATPTSGTFVAIALGGLSNPSGVAWGPDGAIYVTDLAATSPFTGKIIRYDSAGLNPTIYATPGSKLSFQFPSMAAFDTQGRLYTANLGPANPPNMAGSIFRYSSTGAFASTLVASSSIPAGPGTTGFSPSQLLILQSPTPVVVASFFDSALYEVDSETGAIRQTLIAPYSSATLSGPAGQTTASDGSVIISSQFNNRILILNRLTGALTDFIPSATLQTIATSFSLPGFAPAGLQFGPDGNLYVSMNGGQSSTAGAIVRFNMSNGVYSGTYFVVASNLLQPSGLKFGSAPGDTNNLYVSNTFPASVLKITGATGFYPTVNTFVAPGSGGLNYPSGMAWGADGNFYLVDLGATNNQGNVLKFSPTGTYLSTVTAAGFAPGGLLFQFPSDVMFDGRGRMLTANLGPAYPPNLAGSINSYTTSGSFNKALVTSAQFPGGTAPSQLALAPVSILGVSTNSGAVQRSKVTTLDVTFNHAVNIQAGAFTMTRIGMIGGNPGDNATVTVNVSTTTVNGRTIATLTFSGANTDFGSLADGKWKLTVDSSKVFDRTTGETLRTNFDSVASGVAINRLFGDIDGNSAVNLDDLGEFSSTFPLSVSDLGFQPAFDFNVNNTINLDDLSEFSSRFTFSL